MELDPQLLCCLFGELPCHKDRVHLGHHYIIVHGYVSFRVLKIGVRFCLFCNGDRDTAVIGIPLPGKQDKRKERSGRLEGKFFLVLYGVEQNPDK